MSHFRSLAVAAVLSTSASFAHSTVLTVDGLSGVDFMNGGGVNDYLDLHGAMQSAGYTGQYDIVSASLTLNMDDFDDEVLQHEEFQWYTNMINPDGELVNVLHNQVSDFMYNERESLYFYFGNNGNYSDEHFVDGTVYNYVFSDGVQWIAPDQTYEYLYGNGGFDGANFTTTFSLGASSLLNLNNDGYLDYYVTSFGTWSLLTSTWTIEFYEAGTQAPAVPVPAAAWLFGSGLLGLIGVARRKS